MRILKKIALFIFEPVRVFGSRNLTSAVVSFFDRHKWLIYVLAFLITLGIVLFFYQDLLKI